jgi:sensor c-di-GMP phosphodiesterase-like protein
LTTIVALGIALGGLLYGKVAGEEARLARWKQRHGRFLTDDDRNTLATQAGLSWVVAQLRRLLGADMPT